MRSSVLWFGTAAPHGGIQRMINEQLTREIKRSMFVQLAAAHLCAPAEE
jgi:hypothetical protein